MPTDVPASRPTDDRALARSDERAPQRREAASARALLLTMLGEFVLARPGPVWTGVFVEAFAALGVEEKAARQSLARTAAEGIITPEKVGRRTRWSLTPRGTALLGEGRDRIYRFMREQRQWDGRWIVLAVTVPETQRQLRHRLRTRLTWIGMGSPAPGLWVVPNADLIAQIDAVVSDLQIATNALSWVGSSAGIGDPLDVVSAAWELDEVERAYHDFTGEFVVRRPEGNAQTFIAQVELVQAWRRFPFFDPALPAELLDHEWPGPDAAAAFHRCRERWHRRAQANWDAMCRDAEERQ